MSLYDITGNALLSPAAAALDAASLSAYTSIAEALLQLNTVPVFTASGDVATVKSALALQVDRILDVGGESGLLKSWTDGARSETYRDGIPLLSDLAETLIQSLTGAPSAGGSTFEPFLSYRTSADDASSGAGFLI